MRTRNIAIISLSIIIVAIIILWATGVVSVGCQTKTNETVAAVVDSTAIFEKMTADKKRAEDELKKNKKNGNGGGEVKTVVIYLKDRTSEPTHTQTPQTTQQSVTTVVPPAQTQQQNLIPKNVKKNVIKLTFNIGGYESLWVLDYWVRKKGASFSNQADNGLNSWNWEFPAGSELDAPSGISGRLKDGRNFVRADYVDTMIAEECPSDETVYSWCSYDGSLRKCTTETYGGIKYYINNN